MGLIGRLRAPQSAPRDYARDARAEMLAALAGVEVAPFGRPPPAEELLPKIIANELDLLLKPLKLASRKGATAEKRALQEQLAAEASQRADQLVELRRDERPERLLNTDQVAAAVLNSSDPGPFAEALWNQIAADPGLTGVAGPKVLAVLASDQASERGREVMDRKLAMILREELSVLRGGLGTPYGLRDRSQVCGFFQESTRTLLHLLGVSEKWRTKTICGKAGPYPASRGAWKEAKTSNRYRRCRECEKLAGESLSASAQQRAEAESKDDLPSGLSTADRDAVINDPEIREALAVASSSEEAFEALRANNVSRSPGYYAAPGPENNTLRTMINRNIAGPMNKCMAANPKETTLWSLIGTKYLDDLKARGIDPNNDEARFSELFPPEMLQDVVKICVQRRNANLTGDSAEASKMEDALRDLVRSHVESFIASNPAPDQA